MLYKRTHMCGELRLSDEGKNVVLNGWVSKARSLGSLVFVDIRDKTGITQVTFNEDVPAEVLEKAKSLSREYCIGVKGVVKERSSKNSNIPTGDIEVFADDLTIYSTSETPPIYIKDDDNVNDELRLKYRYLDLRKQKRQRNLTFRHKIVKCTRDYFDEQGFTEVETPVLIKPTPEGARDYIVPSRVHNGYFYALPQSPQMFKQLLMVGGTDRYVQIAKCFRDEDLRADRQPEFTQIDLEMSFVEEDDVMAMNEGFLRRVFKECLDVDIPNPLPRIKWIDAMNRYGSDKPDVRFGMELVDLTDIVKDSGFSVFANAVKNGGSVRCINVKGGSHHYSRKEIDAEGEFVKTYKAKGLAWMNYKDEGIQSPILKFLSAEEVAAIEEKANFEKGDLLFIVADQNSVVWASLGALRLKVANKLHLIPENTYALLWVVEFPQFEWSEEEGRFMAMHHPFTSPMDEDLDLIETNPGAVRAKAYDIVLNGNEIGGGSIRIHSAELQKRMFKALGFTEEAAQQRFGFLLNAFKYGTPPHGGLAYGLDRLAMLICGASSIRDVIAFPKVQNASDPLTGAPYPVEQKQLDELHISFKDLED